MQINDILKPILYFIIIVVVYIAGRGVVHSVLNSSQSYDKPGLSMDMCRKITNKMNKSYPQVIDKITKIKAVACLPGSNYKPVSFAYIAVIDTNSREWMNLGNDPKLIANTFKNIKEFNINFWCTTPQQVKLLRELTSVNWKYYSPGGKYLGGYTFSNNDC